MTKTKRILIAKRLEHVINLSIINKGDKMLDHRSVSVDKMTTKEIRKQINMQKIHNARTKRAMSNLNNNEKLLARYGGIYTQAEINLLQDLHPYLRSIKAASTETEKLSKDENLELLKRLNMFAKYAEDDNYLMI